MKTSRLIAAAGIAGALAFAAAAPVFAQSPGNCVELCDVSCIKPLSIPDRWDDTTPIAGYAGEIPKKPVWRNNGRFDHEDFNDLNGNHLWDPGEAFADGNANGIYDSEVYNPLITGYSAGPNAGNGNAPDGDLGLEITLKANNGTAPSSGQYYAIDLPPVNRGTPLAGGGPFRENLAGCNPGAVGPGDQLQTESGNMVGPTNQGMRDLIAQDPDAYWDPVTGSVRGSPFPRSPRIILLTAHDPRVSISSGNSDLTVTRILAFFMESMVGNAEVRGRFLRVTDAGLGSSCGGGSSAGGFVVTCPTPANATSWGRLKGIYR